MSSQSKWLNSTTGDTDRVITEDGLSNGTCEPETMVAPHYAGDSGDVPAEGDHLSLSNDGLSEFSNSDLSLPEVCISANSNSFEEDMNYEVQQAYKIFTGFLSDKHKGITSLFLHPIGSREAKHGIEGVRGWGQAQLRHSMCLKGMEEKFNSQQYDSITEFVTDFRLMLENCYRFHGVDHWVSRQAQKLEIMLEQKLTLLSRTLREKTTLAVTSKGRFGAEEERGSGGTSTRRRLAPRSLATITVGGHESVMVQTLRLEEQQKAKDEKRQRELEKKEAEEMSAKEVEEWEQSLLSEASPHTVGTLWELPAIGHFLCLAQTALNLPEIIFFELERCLLMPRCSTFLSKIMTSLLSPPQQRATLHRRPALPYHRWELELRQRVMLWYRAVGASRDQPSQAEQLGLCHQFFTILGEVSPLEEKPFHLLPFYQRVWLLKGLCDNVYETQKDVQDALLSQPIHECRESILGYDSQEYAYIHFPHFCGADLRIYRQSPSTPPAFPLPSVWVKRVEMLPRTEADSDGMKNEAVKSDRCYGGTVNTESDDFEIGTTGTLGVFRSENWDGEEDKKTINSWPLKEEESELGPCGGDPSVDSKTDSKICVGSSLSHSHSPFGRRGVDVHVKEETVELQHQSKQLTLKREQGFSMGSMRAIKAETQEPCLSVGEHSYTGRSPARLVIQAPPAKSVDLKIEAEHLGQGHQRSKTCSIKADEQSLFESTQNSSEERTNDKIWTKKRRWKKKQGREQQLRVKEERKRRRHVDRVRRSAAEAAKSAVQGIATAIQRKDKKKKRETGKQLESSKNNDDEPLFKPSFMLVCTSLEELRQLISKIEDELDDLESKNKKLGWSCRREAVKNLHSTLIRLLNELLPWEPKLLKAFQRNRLHLKKESDDFKKHPEYTNFVREECSSSSSSSEDDNVASGLGKEMCPLSNHYRRSEEEDLEHVVPRGLWSGASTREFVAESTGERMLTCVPSNPSKHPLASTDKSTSLVSRVRTGSSSSASTIGSGSQSRTELIQSNESRDSNSTWASSGPGPTSLSLKPPTLHPIAGLPKGYTPIPTLLAKSVGNKVTLMKCPADYPGLSNIDGQSKGSLVSLPTSVVSTTKLSEVENSPVHSSSSQNSQQVQTRGLKQTEVSKRPETVKLTAALFKSPQTKQTQTVPTTPTQMFCNVSERLAHLVRTDKASAAVDQRPGEKNMQHIVIQPSSRFIHKTEEQVFPLHQSKDIQVPDSEVASPLCMSTNVPGFAIPENCLPLQQVVSLKDVKTLRKASPVCPRLQQGSMITAGFKGTQLCNPQASTTQAANPNPSPITPPCATSTEPVKSTGTEQELKTVCIRDSQSILVTTRGGNTGIVKVQTSSDQNALGYLPANPVITISPQFKALLISKSSQTLASSACSQSSPCTIPPLTSISVAQTQNQISSTLKPPSTVKYPMVTAVSGSVPDTGCGSKDASTTVGQCSNNSASSTDATKPGQQTQMAAAGSHFQSSLVKNTVGAPTLSGSDLPQVFTQAELISKTGVKRPTTDERSQPTKFILVTPSSSSASNIASSQGTTCSAKSLSSSRVVFISQPTATTSSTSLGSIPKHAIATDASGQLLASSLTSQTLKMGLSPSHPGGIVNSGMLTKVKNITLPSGVQTQLSGKMANIGQTIGTLPYSPSKSTPVSIFDACQPAAIPTDLVLVTSSGPTIASCSDQLGSGTSLTTTSRLQCIPSFTKLSQTDSSSSTLTVAEMIKNDHGRPPAILSSMSQLAVSKNQSISLSRTTNTQTTTTTATGKVQQRILINTSTHLAAGTHILLNNARFVIPPQGLGPGSHVLVISSAASQQVPAVSATSTVAPVPSQMTSPVTVAPGASFISQSAARLSCVSVTSCPTVACTPAIVPSLLPTNPKAKPVQSTPGLGSTVLPCNTNVVPALPRLPVTQAGNFAPPVGSLFSPPPRLGNVLPSSVVTSAAAVSSSLATIRCSSTLSSAVAHPLSRLSAPLSSLPVLPNSSVPTTFSSAVAPVVAGTPALRSSLPAKQVISVTIPGLVIQP